MNVKEKAVHWLNNNVAGWEVKQLETLIVLLKEQDRDTRHACADNIFNTTETNGLMMKDRSHNIIINTRDGIE